MEAVEVVQRAVVGLAHGGQCPEVIAATARLDRRGNQGIADGADAVGVRDPDRAGQHAVLPDPFQAGELTVAVEPMRPGEDGLGPDVAVMRQHHRDTGAHGTLADAQLSITANDRGMPDPNAGHVGDGVVLAGLHAPDANADVPGSRRHRSLPPSGLPRRRG